jgi:hypothetical protein
MSRSQVSIVDAWLLASEVDHKLEKEKQTLSIPSYTSTKEFNDFMQKY